MLVKHFELFLFLPGFTYGIKYVKIDMFTHVTVNMKTVPQFALSFSIFYNIFFWHKNILDDSF